MSIREWENPGIITLDEQDDSTAMTPRLILAPQGTDLAQDEFVLQSIADGLSSSGNRRMQVVDALCAIVAEKAIALKTIETREALDMLLPTARLLQRNLRNSNEGMGSHPFDMALYELYQMLIYSADPMERMRIGFALGDRATHFTGGWTGSRTLGRVMSKQEQTKYGTAMAARGYAAAESVAKTKPTHPEARAVTQSVPGIKRNFGNIVQVLRSLHEKDLEGVKGLIN